MTTELLPPREATTEEVAPEHRTDAPRGRWLGPHCAMLLAVIGTLVAFFLLRTAMFLWYVDWRELSVREIFAVFTVGLRFDLLVALCLVLPGSIHVTLASASRRAGPIQRWMLRGELMLLCLFLPLICVVEWIFFEEFESRLNYIAFEYLVYPTEVCCNIWESYAVVPILSIVAGLGIGLYFLVRRPFWKLLDMQVPTARRWTALTTHVGLIALLWFTSGVHDRNISNDRVANECAWNGCYSFICHAWTCRLDYPKNYFTIDEQAALTELRHAVVRPEDRLLTGSNNPVDRIVVTGKERRDWNVVLILEESFGANFVGALGDDRGLTPEFDALVDRGLLFDRFYATGNRTARALEAVLTSMPPLPTESILKRDHSEHVQTLAHVLEKRGYRRLFVTGGRGVFDGVRSFMMANGFDRFIELSDFENPAFTNAWGVSDEDLFDKALEELDALHADDQPFFATLLTVSNHRPYTYPAGRIPQTEQTRENAVRYADWALGRFFREAQQHEFHRDTLFVVLGDHGARVYGSQLFPMSSYRIPVLMILPEGEEHRARCSTLACSLDIPPTILGMLGGEYRSVFFGQDALAVPPEEGRAIMQHNHDVALLDSRNHMAVLGFGDSFHEFVLDDESFELDPVKVWDFDLLERTAALFQSTFQLYYSDRWFPDPQVEDR